MLNLRSLFRIISNTLYLVFSCCKYIIIHFRIWLLQIVLVKWKINSPFRIMILVSFQINILNQISTRISSLQEPSTRSWESIYILHKYVFLYLWILTSHFQLLIDTPSEIQRIFPDLWNLLRISSYTKLSRRSEHLYFCERSHGFWLHTWTKA